jgi:hypothetical protein
MAKRASGKVHVSDKQTTKHFDQSSNNLMMRAPDPAATAARASASR